MPATSSDFAPQDVFSPNELERELRQTEIISMITQYIYDPVREDVQAIQHSFAIIANQDCDLLWDYEDRSNGGSGTLANVLFFEAKDHQQARSSIGGSDLFRRVIQNQDERYHFLEACPTKCDASSEGFPALIIDFKRFFSLPISQVYQQIIATGGASRRCRLTVSYREHFQTRAAYFMQRVMLPPPSR